MNTTNTDKSNPAFFFYQIVEKNNEVAFTRKGPPDSMMIPIQQTRFKYFQITFEFFIELYYALCTCHSKQKKENAGSGTHIFPTVTNPRQINTKIFSRFYTSFLYTINIYQKKQKTKNRNGKCFFKREQTS